jgi:uncharacterized membrane protein
MKFLRNSFSERKTISPKAIAAGWLVFSLVGFLDATYLTIQHYRGAGLECGELWDCNEVIASQYAVIGGVPLPLLGAIYYLLIFLLSVAYFDSKLSRILTIIALLTILGFLASLVLFYLQVFVIRALCLYCLISALSSTSLFMLAVIYRIRFRA